MQCLIDKYDLCKIISVISYMKIMFNGNALSALFSLRLRLKSHIAKVIFMDKSSRETIKKAK